jgi:hypothetical protein
MPILLLQKNTCGGGPRRSRVQKDRYHRALGERNVRDSAQIAKTLSFGLAREFETLPL